MKIDTYWYIRADYQDSDFKEKYCDGKYVDLCNHYTGEILITLCLDEDKGEWHVSNWQEGCFDGFVDSDDWGELDELTKKLLNKAYNDIYDTDLEEIEENIPC